MELQEGLAEAGGEGRRGLGDAALGTGEFGGEAAQEVVFGLLRSQDAHRRQHAEGIGAQEDHLLGGRALAFRTDDLLDVIDRVADAGVLGDFLVGEVDLALLVDGYVLEERVAVDGAVDVGLCLLVEVDDLGVAAAFEVEDALVVPAVLVVADQQAFRVGGEGGLAGAGETEEDGGVLALHIRVRGAVHRGDALQGQIVVHHGEHALLHLAAVPGVEDDLLTAGNVEGHAGGGVEAELLVVDDLRLGGGVDHEVGLEGLKLFLAGLDEHVAHEVGLPGDLHDEADGHAGVGVGAAVSVDHEEALVAQLLHRDILDLGPDLLGHGVVVILITVGGPPHGVAGVLVHDDVLVLGRAAGVYAGHDVDGVELGQLADVIAFQLGLGLFREKELVGRVVDDLGAAGDTVFVQINSHS